MATDFNKAADDARRILKGFRAFAEVADALDAAGQIEQRTAEAQRVLADIQPQVAAARAEIDKAKAEAKAIVDKAKDQAADHVAAAKKTASEIVGAAEASAAQARAKAEALIDAANNKVAAANAQAQAALAKHTELTLECEALEARLAKAKGSIAKLLG